MFTTEGKAVLMINVIFFSLLSSIMISLPNITDAETPAYSDSMQLYTPFEDYDFDYIGQEIQDVSGNDHHGNLVGCEFVDNSKFGRAINFDGVDDMVDRK